MGFRDLEDGVSGWRSLRVRLRRLVAFGVDG